MRCSITTVINQGREPATWAWCGDRERPAKNEDRARTHRLDWSLAAYWLALLMCGSIFGLVVGGYVGYMEAATPAVDAPASLMQLATTDVQWTAMVRQYLAASHPLPDSGPVSCNESRWQRLVRSTNEGCVSGAAGGTSCSFGGDERSVHHQSPIGNDIHDTVVTP